MYPKERLDQIIALLRKNGYVTVKYLTDVLHYSTATINRDLNLLQKQKLIKRSYGGAELIKNKSTPFVFRHHKMRTVKNKLAKKAAEFIKNGETVFIDASTTTQCIGQYIVNKKDITIITNNMELAIYLSENGISVICLGGKVTEAPSVLCSQHTIENASAFIADKFFFSAGGITPDGKILSNGGLYLMMQSVMAEHSKESFFLVDHEKINVDANQILFDLNHISYIITDYEFGNETKERFKNTTFININNGSD